MFINEQNSITMSPQVPAINILQAVRPTGNMSFDQASVANNIYARTGSICYRKMCSAMTGCEDLPQCPQHPDWKKVQEFCGSAGPGGSYVDGAWYKRQDADAQQNLLSSTKKATGMSVLPNPYNVVGMY